MNRLAQFLNRIVTALLLVATLWLSPATAQTPELDRLFERLGQPVLPEWEVIEQEIWTQWSRSGSRAMDLLLLRGRNAMDAGDFGAAIAHLTALTDHAPEFAEGWNARATAYFMAGQFGPSIGDIRQTLLLNPRHFGALSGLGMMLEQLELPKDALAAYRAALAIHPHRPDLNEAITRLEKTLSGETL